MATAPGSAATSQLGRVGHTLFSVTTTSEPWDLEVDALVVSVGSNGYGLLGDALRRARPDLIVPTLADLNALVSPTKPWTQAVVLREAMLSSESSASSSAPGDTPNGRLKHIVYASIRDAESSARSGQPPSLPTIVQASASALDGARQAGARSVALPIFGTGLGGVDLEPAATAVLGALRDYVQHESSDGLDEIVVVTPSAEQSDVVRAAWRGAKRSVQLRMLADAPIDDEQSDVLGVNAYAAALAFVVDHPDTGTPFTLAINAPWGAGKTSLAKLTEKQVAVNRLRFQDPIVCWFNAWHHDDAPTIVPALASAVARAAAGQRNRWRRILDPLPSRMLTPKGRRKRHFITVLLSLVVAAIALLLAGAFHSLTTADHVTIPIVVALATAGARELSAVRGTAADLGSLVRTPGAAFASGSLDEVRGDLGRLIHQATQRGRNRRPPREHRRLFVYIDDLERCQPERSIEVCETVSGLLSHEDVVVVLIGDMQTLATAAEVKYKDLAPRYRTGTLAGSPDAPLGSFGELYLEKIIQFRFDLPTHNATALKALVSRLLAAAAASVPGGPVKRGARSVVESERRWLVRQLSRAWHPILDFRQARARRREDNRVKAALLTGVPPSGPDVGASQAQGVNRAEQQFDLQMLLRRIEGADLDESYDAVADRVRPLPRDLKRLLNRIRFLLYLTTDRGLMQPAGPLAAGAIGKWALLAERWPDLAVTISANPDILTGLESASATDAGFVAAMADIVPGYARSAELRRLLVTPPALGSVAECLSRLAAQPAT